MTIKSFLNLVEIRTKVASVLPWLVGTGFVIDRYKDFHWQQGVIFFIAMLLFDMTATATNNYMDYKKAEMKTGFGYEEHNAITKDGLRISTVKWVILFLLGSATGLGILLVLYTDWLVLLLGMLCFALGLLYSVGPVPISRTPFGELFSGMTMGFLIPFLAAYTQSFDQNVVKVEFSLEQITLSIDWQFVLSLFLVTVPLITGIANIMLANNICDMQEDIVNKRYTLPIYIGKKKALYLFAGVYGIGYVAILVAALLKIVSPFSLVTLLTSPMIVKNVKTFQCLQTKKDTFVLAVKNFTVVALVYGVSIWGTVLL